MRSNKTLSYFRQVIKKSPNLTGKEKEILVKRLQKKTLQGIGDKFGLTEARIRQIERKALGKVKSVKKQLTLFSKRG